MRCACGRIRTSLPCITIFRFWNYLDILFRVNEKGGGYPHSLRLFLSLGRFLCWSIQGARARLWAEEYASKTEVMHEGND